MALCIADKAFGVTSSSLWDHQQFPVSAHFPVSWVSSLSAVVGERDKLLGLCGATYQDQQPTSMASFQYLF